MRNSFMPHFEACIRGDGSGWTAPAFGVMCSYNSINGVPACVSPYVPLAYTEWSFRGTRFTPLLLCTSTSYDWN